MNYKLYVATNAGNQNTWVPINTNISYKVGQYILPTTNLTPGNYVAIVQAVDSGSPAATGTGTSGTFTVNAKPVTPPVDDGDDDDNGGQTPDDGRQLKEAEITKVSPEDKSTIKNQTPIIQATLIPTESGEVKKDTIKIMLDDKDVTKNAETEVRDVENATKDVTITHKTKDTLSNGEHKVTVSFEDTKGNTEEKTWTFTVESETSSEDEIIDIFGFKVSKRNALIGGLILLGLLILILVVPWILYGAFKKKDDDNYYQTYASYKPTGPSGGSSSGLGASSSYYDYQPVSPTPATPVVTETTIEETAPKAVEVEKETVNTTVYPFVAPVYTPIADTTQTSQTATETSTENEEKIAVEETPVYTPVFTAVQPTQEEPVQGAPTVVEPVVVEPTIVEPIVVEPVKTEPLVYEPAEPAPALQAKERILFEAPDRTVEVTSEPTPTIASSSTPWSTQTWHHNNLPTLLAAQLRQVFLHPLLMPPMKNR